MALRYLKTSTVNTNSKCTFCVDILPFFSGGRERTYFKKEKFALGFSTNLITLSAFYLVFGTLTLIFHLSHHIILGGKCQNKHKHDTY